jgi:hypothetical protein
VAAGYVKTPFEPDTVPLVVVLSPQLMVAAKFDAVSLVLVSVNVATVVVPAPHPQSPRSG